MFHYRRPHEAAPATLSGSGISTLPSRHGRGLKPRRPRNSSVPPGRPVKATGSPPKRVLGVGGSAGGQPRGDSSTGRVQNVRRSRPGSNQSDRGSLGDWATGRKGAGRRPGSTPHRQCLPSPQQRSSLVPQGRPRTLRTGPAWFGVSAWLHSLGLCRCFSRQQREASGGPGGRQ